MTCQDIFTPEPEGWRREGACLVDVRERGEYVAGHISICAGGGRSSRAAAHLASLGRAGLLKRSGGTAAWVREGRGVTRGEQP